MKIQFKRLKKDAIAPVKVLKTDAGFDICIAERYKIVTDKIARLSTGIAINIPDGYYGKIESRSGFAAANLLDIKGGVIDAGYVGEIQIIISNTSSAPIELSRGDRICQIIIHKLPIITFEEVTEFKTPTARGASGFGSSGKGVKKIKINPKTKKA